MRQRYKVVLELSSNFEGEPDRDVELKTIKSYLESIAGIGSISVTSVDPMGTPELVETTPASVLSWVPESPTRKDLKRPRASKRPRKV